MLDRVRHELPSETTCLGFESFLPWTSAGLTTDRSVTQERPAQTFDSLESQAQTLCWQMKTRAVSVIQALEIRSMYPPYRANGGRLYAAGPRSGTP